MNEMYDCSGCFDRFGGVVERPDDYYFEPRADEEPEWQRPDEADSVCWGDLFCTAKLSQSKNNEA